MAEKVKSNSTVGTPIEPTLPQNQVKIKGYYPKPQGD
jgi:hypothetical protein